MILGHCGGIPYMPYRHFIFSFHMPLFFIISGYLYNVKDVKVSIIKDAKHLMIPYFVTCGAVVLLTLTKNIIINDNFQKVYYYIAATFIGSGSSRSCLWLSHVPNIGAIWFFPALFICKNVYNSMASLTIKKKLLYSSAIFFVSTIIGRYLLFIPFSVLSGLSAIIFYSIGDFFKTNPKFNSYHWIIGLICWFIAFNYSHLYLVQPKIDLYFIDVIGATTASICIYNISTLLNKITYFSGFLSWIGKNSMYILCFHLIDLNVGISSLLTYYYNLYYLFDIILKIIIPLLSTYLFVIIKNITDTYMYKNNESILKH